MDPLDQISENRQHLFAIAYRMLGSVTDAEDIVQATYLRWHKAQRESVKSPKAYLSKVVTRLCIDHLRSVQAERDRYVGPWLPEPLVTDDSSIFLAAAMRESLSMAFLVLLERLSPIERAAFVLREVFDYDYSEIAEVIGKSNANCRQIVHRARDRLAADRRHHEATRSQGNRLTEQFLETCQSGDLQALEAMFEDDITLWSDGGGQTFFDDRGRRQKAALNPIRGDDAVGRFLLGTLARLPVGAAFSLREVNADPGLIAYANGKPIAAIALEIEDSAVRAIRVIVNPDKLAHLPPMT